MKLSRAVAGAALWLLGCSSPLAFLSGGANGRVDEEHSLALLALFTNASRVYGSAAEGTEYIAATSLRAGAATGELYLFRKSDSGCELSLRDTLTVGGDPYDISRSLDSRTIYVANSADGTISVVRLDDSAASLALVETATVAGPGGNSVPFGMSYHASGRLYAADGDGTSGSVAELNVDTSTGRLSNIAPDGYIAAGNQMWFAVLDRTQNYLFATHYGGSQVYRYSVDAASGALTQLGTTAAGTQPWHVNIHPTGDFLYVTNSGSASVSMYAVDTASGALSSLGGGTIAAAGMPIGLAVGRNYAFAAGRTGNGVSIYSIDASSGVLTAAGTESTGSFQPYGLGLSRDESCLYLAETDDDADAADGADRVAVYRVAAGGSLVFVESQSAGIGPRFFSSLSP